MKPKIFVDGQEGTTGLRIHELLAARSDLDILKIAPDLRKDPAERKKLLNAADVVFLCLPDVASREAVALIDNPSTCVIDASTAFRTDPAWAYGLPELDKSQRQKIRAAKRIAVPGCHASAFILAVRPLVSAGIIPADSILTCYSLTGYSGGGKKMIAQYEAPDRPTNLIAPRHYALGMNHKHLPEMQVQSGLMHAPLFTPVVCPVHSGLALQVFLPVGGLKPGSTVQSLRDALASHYAHEAAIQILPGNPKDLEDGFLDITACNGTNRADIFVFGNNEQATVIVRLDNLGKGASGAAIQNMNIVLECAELTGLCV